MLLTGLTHIWWLFALVKISSFCFSKPCFKVVSLFSYVLSAARSCESGKGSLVSVFLSCDAVVEVDVCAGTLDLLKKL